MLVNAIPCICKDLEMCVGAYASLTVQLHKDGYTSKTRESNFLREIKPVRVEKFNKDMREKIERNTQLVSKTNARKD